MSRKDISDSQVLAAYVAARMANDRCGPSANVVFPEEVLQLWTGQCEKVCLRAMERAEVRGLLEYGVSLRSGWLTDKGFELLGKAVEEHEEVDQNAK